MDREKVFKELVERLAQSAYYYGVHKNVEWKETLTNDKKVLLDKVSWFIEQAERAEIYKKALMEIGSNKFISEESGIANGTLIKADLKFGKYV